jgi:hypothetical protein
MPAQQRCPSLLDGNALRLNQKAFDEERKRFALNQKRFGDERNAFMLHQNRFDVDRNGFPVELKLSP